MKGNNGMGREDTSETMSLKARIVQALKSETEKGASDVELATLRLIECALGTLRRRLAFSGCYCKERNST